MPDWLTSSEEAAACVSSPSADADFCDLLLLLSSYKTGITTGYHRVDNIYNILSFILSLIVMMIGIVSPLVVHLAIMTV